MKVSVFGNPDLTSDSLPLRLLTDLEKELPQVEFIHQDPNEECQPLDSKEWWIIDTIKGINKVELIEDIDKFKNQPRVTMHDFDLGMQLKLIKKINPDLKIRIIGVPEAGEAHRIINEIVRILST